MEQLGILIIIFVAAVAGVLAAGKEEHLGLGIFVFFFVIALVGALVAYAS